MTCAVYAKEHGLTNETGWKQFQKYAHKAKTLQHLVYDAKHAPKFWQIVYKFGVRIPPNVKKALQLDCKNGNTYWAETIKAEHDQLFEYNSFWASRRPVDEVTNRFFCETVAKKEGHILAQGNLTEPPCELVYLDVASLQS